MIQKVYLTLGYWLVGNPVTSCTVTGDAVNYVNSVLSAYKMLFPGTPFPYPAP